MNPENDSSAVKAAGRLLFVDDEENILRSLKRLFMDEEYELFTATSGREALAILEKQEDIAVIVSDQRMPEMEGVEFLEKSRQVSPLSIRILLTGYADVNAAIDAINRAGLHRYLNKPWRDDELIQTVRTALQSYSLIKENQRLNGLVLKQNKELKRWNDDLEKMVQEQTEELQTRYDDLRHLNSEMRKNFKSTIMSFSSLLELRDKRMRSHSRNVAEMASIAGRILQLSAAEKETLLVGALLHDIGKIAIPDIMLQSDPEQMSAHEYAEYVQHPVRGQAAVDLIENLRDAGLVIRHHHERYDGEGFPDRLKRKDIPMAARIISILDFIDRKIRKFEGAAGVDAILQRVEEEAGKSFDPKLVPLLVPAARKYYREHLTNVDQVELELYPKDLKTGMVVSRDVYSGTGILLLGQGTVLDEKGITLLRRYHNLDPSRQGVFVSTR
jgi:response regulator RpfG family c-di-GMP phosphodiesterase